MGVNDDDDDGDGDKDNYSYPNIGHVLRHWREVGTYI